MRKLFLAVVATLILAGCSDSFKNSPEDMAVYVDTLGQSCKTDADCLTPMDYLIQSNCPFGSICQAGSCVVTCPVVEPQICEQDSDCNCENRGDKSLDCVCHDGSCLSIEDRG